MILYVIYGVAEYNILRFHLMEIGIVSCKMRSSHMSICNVCKFRHTFSGVDPLAHDAREVHVTLLPLLLHLRRTDPPYGFSEYYTARRHHINHAGECSWPLKGVQRCGARWFTGKGR